MAGLWSDESQSHVKLDGNSYVRERVLYAQNNVAVFCAYNTNKLSDKRIVTQIVLNSSLYGLQEETLLERIDKINGRFHEIRREFELLKQVSENEKTVFPYKNLHYTIQTEPYEIIIDLESEYFEPINETGYYSRPPMMKHGEVVQIALMLCYNIKKMLSIGIYHRGISPRSVALTEKGGYGLSSAAFWRRGKEDAAEYDYRARSFIAPELFEKKDGIEEVHFEKTDEQTEIYSIGAFLYEILDNNHILFWEESSDYEEAERRRLSGEIPPLPDTGTKRLGTCVVKACSPRLIRYKKIDEFIAELEDIYKKMPFHWKSESINGSFYDDTVIHNHAPKDVVQEKCDLQDKKVPKVKEKKKKNAQIHKDDYKNMSVKDLNTASKKSKVAITSLLVVVLLVIGIMFFTFSRHNYTRINEMIDGKTYAVAMAEIQKLYENGENVDKICQTYIDACIESGDVQRIPEAMELLSEEVPDSYLEDILDEISSMGKERTVEEILYILEYR